LLEASFPLIWLEGEISNLARPASGHLYFSLKDHDAQVRCALFRNQLRNLRCRPEDGRQVVIRARASLYEGRGDFQLIVESMEDAGEGALQRAFDALKNKLQREGLFDVSLKRELPYLPKRIAVITSPSGAVIHDIIITLGRRFPAIPVLLYPTSVQGDVAIKEIVHNLQLASKRHDCDALILARGGGSLEDLQAFNSEDVARAIRACNIPVVAAVGHETDISIADWVADARAPTPTAAAEMLSPNQAELQTQLHTWQHRAITIISSHLQARQQRLDLATVKLVRPDERITHIRHRLQRALLALQHAQGRRTRHKLEQLTALRYRLQQCLPNVALAKQRQQLKFIYYRLQHAIRQRQETGKQRWLHASQELQTLSPLSTLNRGYAILKEKETGSIIQDSSRLHAGDKIKAQLMDSALECTVDNILTDKEPLLAK